MRKYIIIALIALLAAGCSKPKIAVKEKKPPAGPKTPVVQKQPDQAAPITAVVPATESAPPSSLGAVEGSIAFDRFDSTKGNLFLYIIDESKMPNEVVLVAASIYPKETLKTKKMNYIMKNVPAGKWRILSVWDTAPPFCIMTELFCAASVKDGLGESAFFTMKPGQTIKDVNIEIF
ncbi:MAG: hypothetical protein WCX65_17610 [bacterium]